MGAFTLNNYKAAGVVYEVGEIEYTKKGNWPKRKLFVEVPTSNSGMQDTEVVCFMVMGDEAGSLDYYEAGDWVEILFKIEGRWWKPPNEDKKIHLQSLRPIDIHKGENPFEKNVKVSQDPDDLSPDYVAELAKNVKDYSKEVPAQDTLFKRDEGDDNNGLPF